MVTVHGKDASGTHRIGPVEADAAAVDVVPGPGRPAVATSPPGPTGVGTQAVSALTKSQEVQTRRASDRTAKM